MRPGLIIRADADERIGSGHVMRCLALAQAWQDAGRGPVCLASSALPEGLRERYQREGIRVCMVRQGGAALSSTLREIGASWVLLDGYHFTVQEQRAAKDERAKLLVIDDDGAMGQYVADLVVDSNLLAEERPYASRLAETRLLLGPRFALLRREFSHRRTSSRVDAGLPRVLVTFGGADPTGLSLVALQALDGLEMKITLVIGPANWRHEELRRAAAAVSNVDLVWDASNMRELMDAADVALVAAGVTCLELAQVGVPQLVIATSENQKRVAKGLVEHGLARSLGEAACLTAEDIRNGLLSLLRDQTTRRDMTTRGMTLVDGLGAERVIAAMVEMIA